MTGAERRGCTRCFFAVHHWGEMLRAAHDRPRPDRQGSHRACLAGCNRGVPGEARLRHCRPCAPVAGSRGTGGRVGHGRSAQEYGQARSELSGYQVALDMVVAGHFGQPAAPVVLTHGQMDLAGKDRFIAAIEDEKDRRDRRSRSPGATARPPLKTPIGFSKANRYDFNVYQRQARSCGQTGLGARTYHKVADGARMELISRRRRQDPPRFQISSGTRRGSTPRPSGFPSRRRPCRRRSRCDRR